MDGAPVRTLTSAEAYNGLTFPQTPMQIKVGTWIAGKKDNPEGTVQWAGGYTNFDEAPFLAYYKSITVTDYSNGHKGAKQYRYGDMSGTYQSIVVDTDGSSDDTTSSTVSLAAHPTPTSKPASHTTAASSLLSPPKTKVLSSSIDVTTGTSTAAGTATAADDTSPTQSVHPTDDVSRAVAPRSGLVSAVAVVLAAGFFAANILI